MAKTHKADLYKIYHRLFKEFGPQHWWPGRTKLEIIVGAILTQNTNWTNVEQAIKNLRQKRLLTPQALRNISIPKLAAAIKPAGYLNLKAKRLKNFIRFLFTDYQGRLQKMGREPLDVLRKKLLAVNGVGQETADSILLYAFEKPVFVVDAYTKRILYRHNFVSPKADYQSIQEIFMKNLPREGALFNEYHALIVRLGKEFCKPHPRCESCPLRNFHYSLHKRCSSCYRSLSLQNVCSYCQINF